MRPSRRVLLATLGAAVVGAGCLGFETGQQSDTDGRESSETATDSPTDGFSWSPTATEKPVFGSVDGTANFRLSTSVGEFEREVRITGDDETATDS